MTARAAASSQQTCTHFFDASGDGTGEGRDEHLVPGRGNQPCAELLRSLSGRGFRGSVALEVSTRKVNSRAVREADLRESLEFARAHLAVPTP